MAAGCSKLSYDKVRALQIGYTEGRLYFRMSLAHTLYKLKFSSLYDIFGDYPQLAYESMAKLLHPDVNRHPEATQQFQMLAAKYEEVKSAETYPNDVSFDLTIDGENFAFYRTLKTGDTSTLYLGHDTYGTPVVSRLSAVPEDSAFLQAERAAIRKMSEKKRATIIASSGDITFSRTYPDLLAFSDDIGDRVSVNISQYCGGFLTLAEIICKYGFLSGAQIAAIWNRLLLAISISSSVGIIHGAITPEHILINPASGDVVLCGWAFSVNLGQPIRSCVTEFGAFYPKEAFTKPDISTDIYMSAACMRSAISLDKSNAKVLNALDSALIGGVGFRMKSAMDVFAVLNKAVAESGETPRFKTII